MYLRDTDESHGTLIIDAGSGGGGLTLLGLPGEETFVTADALLIRGSLSVYPEHAGISMGFSDVTVEGPAYVQFDSSLSVAGSLVVDGSMLVATSLTADAIILSNGGLLTTFGATASETHKLDLEVTGTLSVDAASRIDVTGKGYLAGRTTGNTTTGGATVSSGGSYGGLGGSSGGTTNAVYGDYAEPDDWGSGSGDNIPYGGVPSEWRAAGGGLVRIVAGTMQLDGQLLAVGQSNYRAGSGGGIHVAVDTLAGSGRIDASGGNAHNSGGSAGGGGGRIAVYYGEKSGFAGTIEADGGTGFPGGQPGTVFLYSLEPLHVVSQSPLGSVGELIDHVDVGFDKSIDQQTFTAADILLIDPDGSQVPTAQPPEDLGGNVWRITFDEQSAEGEYHLYVGPHVAGLAGHEMDQDLDGSEGEDPDDAYHGTLTIDKTAPGSVSDLAMADDNGESNTDGLTNDDTPNFSWTAPTDVSGISHYEYQVDSGIWTTVAAAMVSVTLDAGAHNFAVRAVDNAGLTGLENSMDLTIDLTAPAQLGGVTMSEDTGTSSDDRLTADATPTFSWSPAADADFWTYQFQVDGGAWTDNADPTVTLTPGQGTHALRVRSLDLAGNASPPSEAFGFSVDTHRPPAPASVSVTDDTGNFDNDQITTDGTPTVSWPAVTDLSGIAHYQYQVDGTGWLDEAGTSVSLSLIPGSHRFDVRAVDAAGNLGMARTATIVVDQQPPSVISHMPNGIVTEPVGYVDVTFDEAMDYVDEATLGTVLTLYVDGVPIPDPGLSGSSLGGGTYRIGFTPQMVNGQFRLEIGPTVADLAGNEMGTPYDATFEQAIPDLVAVSVVAAETDLQFGQTVAVSWTVANDPTTGVAEGVIHDVIYLSADELLDAGDLALLDPVAAPTPLAPGDDYTGNAQVALPLSLDLTEGTYYLIVATDHHGALTELDESNNTAVSDALNVTLPPTPDLTVADVMPAGELTAGQEATFTWTLHNHGGTDATGTWAEAIFVSADNTVGDDILLGTVTFSGTVTAGGSEPRSAVINVPQTFPRTGAVHLVVATDTADEVFESNEDNNATVSDSIATIADSLAITASTTALAETAGSGALRLIVTRSGDVSAPLDVTLHSSDTSEVAVAATLTIPAGQASAALFAEVLDDTIVDPSQVVTMTASAAGFVGDATEVGVIDDETPSLGLEVPVESLTEGEAVTATVSRSYGLDEDPAYLTGSPLSVTLVDVIGGQFTMPVTVEIPAGALAATFELTATDDEIPELDALFAIDVVASGYVGATAIMTIVDNDLPTLSIIPAQAEISEGAGATALTAIVRRAEATSRSLTVQLCSSDTTAAVVPSEVTIPAGETSASFLIGAVDDSIVDGTQLAEISATGVVVPCRMTTPKPTGTATAQITVLDDDGPTLLASFDRELVNEGITGAANLIVSRNTSTEGELVVTLTVGNATELSTPLTATIPDGETSVSVPVDSLEDGQADGNQTAIVTASADGFVSGTDSIVVTDVDLPDLMIAWAEGPAETATGELFQITYRMENRGLSEAVAGNAWPDLGYPGSWTQRVFLSADRFVGNDALVGQYTFEGTMPVGSQWGFQRTISTFAPAIPGDYYVVVQTDFSNMVAEGVETNNTTISTDPVAVQPAYSAQVQTALDVGAVGLSLAEITPVVMSGSATNLDGTPAQYVSVSIHIKVRNTERVIAAITDESGQFSTTWTPLPGEGGRYTIGASHPGLGTAEVQDEFVLMGMKVVPTSRKVNVVEGQTKDTTFTIKNLADLPLTDLSITLEGVPQNLDVTTSGIDGEAIGPLDSKSLEVSVHAVDASYISGTFTLRIDSAEGASVKMPVHVRVEPLVARVSANPGQLGGGMHRGEQRVVEFEITNSGGLETGPINVILPPTDGWMHLVTVEQMGSLAPGESGMVSLLLTPPADMPLTDYSGQIALNFSDGHLTVPFSFRALSDATGDLVVQAVDEYYFYTEEAPALVGARVRVLDAIDGEEIFSGTTDASGRISLDDLTEGYYTVEVRADKHDSYSKTLLIEADQTNTIRAFLPLQTVKATWTVVETQVEDHYEVVIETVFETNVPMPTAVVTVSPGSIDLSQLTAPGQRMQVDFTIENHGLIQAEEVALNFGDHPMYKFTALIEEIGILPAKSKVMIPVIIERVPYEESERAPGAKALKKAVSCTIDASTTYMYVCDGPNRRRIAIPVVGLDCEVTGEPTTPGTNTWPVGNYDYGWVGGGGTGDVGTGRVRSIPINVSGEDCGECEEVVYSFGVNYGGGFLGSVAKQAAEKLLSAVPYLDIEDLDVSLSAGLELTTCCEGDDWFKKEIEVSADLAIEIFVGPKAGLEFEGVEVEGLGEVDIELEAGIGSRVTFLGNVTGTATKACGEEWVFCLDGSLKLDLSLDVFATATVKIGGQSVGGTVSGGIYGGGSINVSKCSDSGWDLGGCVQDVTIGAGVEFTYNDKSYAPSVSAEIFDGTCDDEGTAPAPNLQDRFDRQSEDQPPTSIGETFSQSSPDGVADPNQFLLTAEELAAGLGYGSVEALELAIGFQVSVEIGDAEVDRIISRHAFLEQQNEGVCAEVKMQITQEAVITRDAFEATLELNNDTAGPLENIVVDVIITDAEGRDATDLFGIYDPTTQGFVSADDAWTLSDHGTGVASWLIVPTADAAPEEATVFFVGATLQYTDQGREVTMPLEGVPIWVLPQAELDLKYFHQRDVFSDDPWTEPIEPAQPFELAVMIENRGAGEARNLRITSAQPEIVENEKGLLIDFNLIASQVDGQPMTPSLTTSFGDIEAGAIAIGRWWMTSTLQGLFTSYDATFRHVDGLGDERLSLIKNVEIYEMVQSVYAGGSFDDGLGDFLTNEVADAQDLPDTLHLSDGSVVGVNLADETLATLDGTLSPANFQVTLTATMNEGWSYLRLTDRDPGLGEYKLIGITRDDGTELPTQNFWQTDRRFVGLGQRPKLEDSIHLLDYNDTGNEEVTYTLFYQSLDQTGPAIETLTGSALPVIEDDLDLVVVEFDELLKEGSLTAADLTLTRNAGANLIDGPVTVTNIGGNSYRVAGLSAWTNQPGLYRLTVEAAGVQDVFSNPGSESAMVSWTRVTSGPWVTDVSGVDAQTNHPVGALQISFSEPVDDDTLDLDDVTLLRDGVELELDGTFFSQSLPNVFTFEGLADLTAEQGVYEFAFDAAGVTDLANDPGYGTAMLQWTTDTTPPTVDAVDAGVDPMTPTAAQTVTVRFDEPVAVDAVAAVTLTVDGTPLATDGVTVAVDPADSRRLLVSGLRPLQDVDGQYRLALDVAGVIDRAGNAAAGSAEAVWTLDTMDPTPTTNLAITPDTGQSDTDGVTDTGQLMLSGTLGEPGLSVSVDDLTFGVSLGTATVADTGFSHELSLTTGGLHELRVRVGDAAGNVTESFFDVFFDAIDLTVAEVFGVPVGYNADPVTEIRLALSAPIDPATLTTAVIGLSVSGEGLPVDGIAIEPVAGADATYRLANLPTATGVFGAYTLTVDLTQVRKASSGRNGAGPFAVAWSVVPADTTSPTVDSVVVQNGEVAPHAVERIDVTFSEEMQLAGMLADGSVAAAVGLARVDAAGQLVERLVLLPSEFTIDAAQTVLTWQPAHGPLLGGRYVLQSDADSFLDEAGNALDGPGPQTFDLGTVRFAAQTPLQADGAAIVMDAYSVPALAEMTGDALNDLLVGEKTDTSLGRVAIYRNTGTGFVFESYALDVSGNVLNVPGTGCLGVSVRGIDFNADGLPDLLLGQADGTVKIALNADGPGGLRFAAPVPVHGGAQPIDVGTRAVVEVADLTGDGLFDLVVGATDGAVRLYRNTGTAASPSFAPAVPLALRNGAEIDVPSGRSAPAIADVTGDGRMDLLCGNTSGELWLYANVGDTAPVYLDGQRVHAAGSAVDLPGEVRSRPFVGDTTGDGRPDLLVGSQDGSVRMYEAAATTDAVQWAFLVASIEGPAVLVKGTEGNFTLEPFDNDMTCIWSFGDGQTATDMGILGHTYDDEGSYDIVVTVAAGGMTASATKTVIVERVVPPTVENIVVKGSTWAPALLDYLDTQGLGHPTIPRLGFRIAAGDGQLDTLPWINIDTISIGLSEDVNIEQSALRLWGVNVADYIEQIGFVPGGFDYDEASHTASWTLQQAIGPDKLVVGLDADAVTDSDGNRLDGQWQDMQPTFPSGDGDPGGDFHFGLHVLPGDVNRSAGVIGNDLILVRNALGTASGDPGYTYFNDVDANGLIIGNDLIHVRNRLSTSLPPGEPGVSAVEGKGGPLVDQAVDQALDEIAAVWDEQEDSPKRRNRRRHPRADRMARLAEQLLLLGEDIDGTQRTRLVDRVLGELHADRAEFAPRPSRIIARGRT